jgi:UDP-hydrolysing UDP-N-acetyl-D-glucosamine 2-epimerase
MKILAFTSIRSDYDLLSGLYKLLNADKDVDLNLLVSGAHLSATYGLSVQLIEKDGLSILAKIETLTDSDTKQSRVKAASLLLQNAIDIVSRYNPDVIMYAGDREDTIIAATIAGYLGIPSVHFYGGDHVKDGYIDNPIRHAVSKLSSLHMVSTQTHRLRLTSLGEAKERIHVIGSIALDNFVNHRPVSKEEINKLFAIEAGFDKFALVIFHPITEERENTQIIFENILISLKKHGINALVSYPNSDPGNKAIISVCSKYSKDNNFRFYKNLDRDTFLSVYKNSSFIIGNSSSGICEAASIPIPAINVGLRQTGRYADDNVIFCDADLPSIQAAITRSMSKEFLRNVATVKNSYGDGKSAERAYRIIKTIDFNKYLLKKEDPLDMNTGLTL